MTLPPLLDFDFLSPAPDDLQSTMSQLDPTPAGPQEPERGVQESKPDTAAKRATHVPIDAPPVKLEVYEGPLDLLLDLIRKQQINIYDIPIATITKQYLDYLHILKS